MFSSSLVAYSQGRFCYGATMKPWMRSLLWKELWEASSRDESLCVCIYMYIRTQNHGSWEPSSRWHPGTDTSAELFQSMRHICSLSFAVHWPMVMAHLWFITAKSRELVRNTQVPPFSCHQGPMASFWFWLCVPDLLESIKDWRGKTDSVAWQNSLTLQFPSSKPLEQPCRKWRKNVNMNLAVKHLRQNYEDLVGGYKHLEYKDYD